MYPYVIGYSYNLNSPRIIACFSTQTCADYRSEYILQNHNSQSFSSDKGWIILSPIEQSINDKITAIGIPLKEWNVTIYRGIVTGYNDAFIISGEKRAELIREDPNSAEIIRPILRGKDIRQYGYNFANLYIILAKFGSHEYLENRYPAIYRHLLSYEKQLKERGQCSYTRGGLKNTSKPYPGQHHWLELDNNPSDEYLDDFSKQKIMWKRIGSKLRFSYDSQGVMGLDSTCFAIGEHIEFLAAFLNSYIGNYMFRDSPKTGTGDLIVSVQAIEPIRVPIPSSQQENTIYNLLQKIMQEENSMIRKMYEQQIENILITLYNFTEEEHEYIVNYVTQEFR